MWRMCNAHESFVTVFDSQENELNSVLDSISLAIGSPFIWSTDFILSGILLTIFFRQLWIQVAPFIFNLFESLYRGLQEATTVETSQFVGTLGLGDKNVNTHNATTVALTKKMKGEKVNIVQARSEHFEAQKSAVVVVLFS